MGKNYLWIGVAALVVIAGFYFVKGQKGYQTPTPTPTAQESSMMNKVNVQFINHLQAKLPEQDVFVESAPGATTIVRVEGENATLAATLAKKVFAAAKAVPHDPFKVGPTPLGPYPKGASLGMTLGEWLSAGGGGTYTVDGDNAELALSFTKLVPSGTYTVWCSRLTFPPNPKVVDRPCGETNGSQNMFKADAGGNGTFSVKMKPLEESTKETASVIAVAYHSDGKTYGAVPGEFGLNSHVQLFFLVPPPAGK